MVKPKSTKYAERFRDIGAFKASFCNIALSKANIVRNIIGGQHWLSDGVYKEKVVRDTFKLAITKQYEVSHGFIVTPSKTPGAQYDISNQLDLVIYDPLLAPPIFSDDDFVIILAGTAKVVIEIKSSLSNFKKCIGQELRNSIPKIRKAYEMQNNSRNEHELTSLVTAFLAFENRAFKHDDHLGLAEIMADVYMDGLQNVSLDMLKRSSFALPNPLPEHICFLKNYDYFASCSYAKSKTNEFIIPVIRFRTTQQKCTSRDKQSLALHQLFSQISAVLLKDEMHQKPIMQKEILQRDIQNILQYDYIDTKSPISLVRTADATIRNNFPNVHFL
jgi:hypothetical protein